MFDKAEIRVKAGNGGGGHVAFRREKFVPFGGPDGGDGGNGGNVIVRADKGVDTLQRYRQGKMYQAEAGGNGSGSRKHGRDGADLVLEVPPGTSVTIREGDANVPAADLEKSGDEVVIARGGRGGFGNTHYVSSTNQAPRIAQRGETREEKAVRLEMRLIADVGIIGYPNAGKSTLLAAASAARPKIAGYPFTTLEPMLGVVEIGLETFILAEIPGLIEGAHHGHGLGHDFLRHAMRTRILIHLIDGGSAAPSQDLITLNNELALFDLELARKPQIVVVNKIDIPEVRERRGALEAELGGAGIKVHYVSAAMGQGVDALMKETMKMLKASSAAVIADKPVKVFRPRPKKSGAHVNRRGEEFVITAPGLERVIGGEGVTREELRWQLNYLLKKTGVQRALEKAGAKPGDKIRCGELTWEW